MQKRFNVLKYIIVTGVFLIPFIPLVVSSSLFFPFITGKNFAFRVLVEILLGLWLVLALYDKRYRPAWPAGRPKKSWISIFLIAFVFVLALSSIFGENFYRSFWSNYERMEGLLTHFHLLAYFFILASVLKTEKLWKRFFHTSLGVSAILGIYGLFQLAGKTAIHQSDVRLDATMGNASYLAIYMVFNIFLALFYFAREKEWYRWFYLPLIALQTTVLYYTATRGAILGFVGGILLTILLIALLSEQRRTKILSSVFLVLIAASLGGFWLAKDSSFIRESPVLGRFASISLEETTTQSRFVIWKMSARGFLEKPILGWGPENYNLVFNKYYEPILYKQEPWFDRAHNVFFDRLTTNGIFGLLAYLGLFISAFYYLLLKRKKLGFSAYDSGILAGLLAAYFFHNLFVFDNLISFLFFFAILAYAHNRVVSDESAPSANLAMQKPSEDDYKKQALAAIILIAAVFAIYNFNVPAILASRNLLGAFQESAMGNLEGAFQKFKKAISYDSLGTTEAREHLTSFASKMVSQPNLDPAFKNKVFEFAASEMRKQIAQAPNDIRYMIFLGSLYNKAGQHDLAIDILERSIELAPKKQQLYFELAASHISKKDYEKARELLRASFELEPSFGEARKMYAISLIYAGDDELAEKILKERYGTGIIADQRLINAYAGIKRFDKAATIWEKIIEENPGNAQYRVNLAATYLETGERQKAIEHLQKATEIEPAFKDQGEYYIKEIRAGRNP